MIEIDILGKRFGETAVLGEIRFRIMPGETVALVGPSGIGKTTLLGIVAGTDRRYEGRVTAPRNVAVVFQEPTLLPWRSATDNIRLIHPHLTRDGLEAALAQVGLSNKDHHYPGQLSLGQQRRLALARAFAGEPEFLIMDEPFVSLDADTGEAMLALTEALIARHQPATLFVTHSRAEAERLADRILTLSPGPRGAVVDDRHTNDRRSHDGSVEGFDVMVNQPE